MVENQAQDDDVLLFFLVTAGPFRVFYSHEHTAVKEWSLCFLSFHSVPHGIKEICSDVKESPGQLHPKDHEMMEFK